ncbi:nitrate- and nitrite sensing domain-containing protein [Streptomyces sp. TRM 70351]|uniref:sensor histidine kinase n=1 Tax=Streptomyces sp. TRM 70351 TaxID=3116552 RepID=UPI002E7C48A5|nr:nitrate- and nitrite sensing domain-containing protein [Streptomyces sp. TRM 70351]MEE1927609.1 nitrate- and nitrite sensing domain-containing protein [Streptomyces sp. TRM 70351]
MRARVGEKRLRGSRHSGQDTATAASPAGSPRRRAKVRNRLLASVALCTVAVLGAGAPSVVTGTADVAESQDLVERADTARRAVSLAHALADERDDTVRTLAAPGATPAPDAAQRTRVDRKAAELRPVLPAPVRLLLDRLPRLRQQADAAGGGTEDAHAAYSGYTGLVQALGSLAEDTARALPARAAGTPAPGENGPGTGGTAHALPYLGRAVEHASATRGLLLGVLASGNGDTRLAQAAQLARTREEAALADFERLAPERTRESYGSTVNGTDVTAAERHLDALADAPRLDAGELATAADDVAATLTARIDRMRGVQSALAGAELARLEQLRDDDVTALQLRIALLGAALLLVVGASVHAARSMARPLAAVRRGARRVAADPLVEQPVAWNGRDDEFADVVRAVNALREAAAAAGERAGRAEADATERAAARDRLAAECERLRAEQTALGREIEGVNDAVHGTFVQLARRSLGLIERQLALIESMEEKEAEPERLATLFKLDHMATRMRRHGENLLLLTGAEHATGHHPQPVPLLDVLRAAVSEIERYERVDLTSLPPHAQVAGFAADDVSHLVAELLDNATAFSPPNAEVQLSGWMLENGEVMLSVQDEGIGVTADRLAELNERLGEPGAQTPPSPERPDALGLGLYVVARLAARHGIRVQLRPQRQGGVAAVAVLPRALLPDRPAPGAGAGGDVAAGSAPGLPGSVAEANSNVLPTRGGRHAAPRPAPAAAPEPAVAPEPALAGEPVPPAAPSAAGAPTGPAPTGPAPTGPALPGPVRPSGPDEHGRTPDAVPAPRAAPAPAPASGQGDAAGAAPRRLTDKGLPKRTPHITAPTAGDDERRPARDRVSHADELRKRLGGFQRGAREGLREAAARIAADVPPGTEAGTDANAGADPGAGQDEHGHRTGADDMGGTEEARQ